MYTPRIMKPLFLSASFLALALHLGPSFAQKADKVEFEKEGEVINAFSISDLRSLAPEQSLKVFETHERQNRVYRVVPVRAVFEKVFGKDWEKAQEIVFTSLDGFQPSIPVKKFLEHGAYFAFASEDDAPFTLTNKLQNKEIVPLGPVYLVWDNIGSKELLEAGAMDMPYQIKSIDLKIETTFPNMIPPTGSLEQVQRGFEHFRRYCAACHTINGDGGGKAPELNYPVSVAEYIKPDHLKRWILEPQGIRYNTPMPALGEEISNREKVADEIIAYLKAMSEAKRKPRR
jgi:mono/diheme cytochrome c family protein